MFRRVSAARHLWTFSGSIADTAPEDWGGTSINLD
jgi:hypothetical protein